MRLVVIAALGILAFLVVASLWANRTPTSVGRKPDPDVSETMKILQDAGALERVDWESGEAYLNPTFWTQANVDAKLVTVVTLGVERKRRTGHYFIDIFDYMSGRKIAEYTYAGGAKILP